MAVGNGCAAAASSNVTGSCQHLLRRVEREKGERGEEVIVEKRHLLISIAEVPFFKIGGGAEACCAGGFRCTPLLLRSHACNAESLIPSIVGLLLWSLPLRCSGRGSRRGGWGVRLSRVGRLRPAAALRPPASPQATKRSPPCWGKRDRLLPLVSLNLTVLLPAPPPKLGEAGRGLLRWRVSRFPRLR